MGTLGDRHRLIGAQRLIVRAPALVLGMLAIVLASCGGERQPRQGPAAGADQRLRPARSANVTASPANRRRPDHAAGRQPVGRLPDRHDRRSAGRQSVGPINPEDTATLKVSVAPGRLHALGRRGRGPATGQADRRPEPPERPEPAAAAVARRQGTNRPCVAKRVLSSVFRLPSSPASQSWIRPIAHELRLPP